jgi:hypothetical protein
MIVYSSPKSGKTKFCRNNPGWIDSDKILFKMLNKAFNCNIIDDDTKGSQIIRLFQRNRDLAENTYTDFMYYLKNNKDTSNILLGTRRFMWLADIVFLKDTDHDIYKKEIESAIKWRLPYIELEKNQFINYNLINSLITK